MVLQQLDATNIVAEFTSRLRTLENKYSLLTERVLMVNQNLLASFKAVASEQRALDQELKKLNLQQQEIMETIQNLMKEFSSVARKDQLQVLEKYIDLWKPFQFVTEEQLQQALSRAVKNKEVL